MHADTEVCPVAPWVSEPAVQVTQTVLPVLVPKRLYVFAGQAELRWPDTPSMASVQIPWGDARNRLLAYLCRSLQSC